MSENKNLLKTGIIGATIAGICCVTPILVILFSALGLSALTGYLDYVLLPTLGIFVMVIIYALWKRRAHG